MSNLMQVQRRTCFVQKVELDHLQKSIMKIKYSTIPCKSFWITGKCKLLLCSVNLIDCLTKKISAVTGLEIKISLVSTFDIIFSTDFCFATDGHDCQSQLTNFENFSQKVDTLPVLFL